MIVVCDSMYTADFLLNWNCHVSAQKKNWLKLLVATSVKRAIFNLSKCQFTCTKITDKNYYTLLKYVYKTAFLSD